MSKFLEKFFIIVLGLVLLPNFAFAETRYYTVGTNYGQISPSDTSFSSCDPFYFRTDGNVYYMVVDNSDKYTLNSLLGCTWPKNYRTSFKNGAL